MNVDHHRRVLLVDDDPEILRILTPALQARSLLVDTASGGAEALALLDRNGYAVVILDLIMPEVDGFAVLETIHAPGSVAPPVVLVLTAAERVVVERLDAQRIHGVLRKPFDPDDVATIVAACSEVRARSSLETMAMAVMSGPLLAWLSQRWG